MFLDKSIEEGLTRFGDKEFTAEEMAKMLEGKLPISNMDATNYWNLQLDKLVKVGYLSYDKNSKHYKRNHNLDYANLSNETACINALRDRIEMLVEDFKLYGGNGLCHADINSIKNITINLSHERKTKHSRGVDVTHIEQQIGQLLEERFPEEIKSILQKIKSCLQENRTDNLHYLVTDLEIAMYVYRDYFRIPDRRTMFNHQHFKISMLIRNIEIMQLTYNINGEFDAENFAITLYVENIKDLAIKSKECFSAKLMEIFVHELFHAYHYLSVLNCGGKWVYDNTTEIIIESFASYVQYEFSKYYGILDCVDLEESWRSYDMHVYPYSGAKYIKWNIFNVGARFENFKDIFKINTIMNKNLEFHNPHQLFELSLKDLSAAQQKLQICHKYEELLTHSFVWDTLRFASNQGLL